MEGILMKKCVKIFFLLLSVMILLVAGCSGGTEPGTGAETEMGTETEGDKKASVLFNMSTISHWTPQGRVYCGS